MCGDTLCFESLVCLLCFEYLCLLCFEYLCLVYFEYLCLVYFGCPLCFVYFVYFGMGDHAGEEDEEKSEEDLDRAQRDRAGTAGAQRRDGQTSVLRTVRDGAQKRIM